MKMGEGGGIVSLKKFNLDFNGSKKFRKYNHNRNRNDIYIISRSLQRS